MASKYGPLCLWCFLVLIGAFPSHFLCLKQCDIFEWTVPLRAKFFLCSSSGSSWPYFLAPARASTLPWLSWEEESSCTVSGPEASWTKVSTSLSSLANSSLFILIFPGALLGFALGCRVIAVVGMKYLNHAQIPTALRTFLPQSHYVLFQLFKRWIVGVFDIHKLCFFPDWKPNFKISAWTDVLCS